MSISAPLQQLQGCSSEFTGEPGGPRPGTIVNEGHRWLSKRERERGKGNRWLFMKSLSLNCDYTWLHVSLTLTDSFLLGWSRDGPTANPTHQNFGEFQTWIQMLWHEPVCETGQMRGLALTSQTHIWGKLGIWSEVQIGAARSLTWALCPMLPCAYLNWGWVQVWHH